MKTQTKQLNLTWQVCLFVMLSAVAIMAPDLALAQTATNSSLGNTLCMVSGWFLGNTGRGLATIGIIIIGIGALLGKVSWGMALIVGVGVALIFGASGLVTSLGGGGQC